VLECLCMAIWFIYVCLCLFMFFFSSCVCVCLCLCLCLCVCVCVCVCGCVYLCVCPSHVCFISFSGAHSTKSPPILPRGPINRAGCVVRRHASVGSQMR